MSDEDQSLSISELEPLIPPVDSEFTPGSELDLEESNTFRWNGASLVQRLDKTLRY